MKTKLFAGRTTERNFQIYQKFCVFFSQFPELLVITVATSDTDGFKRYVRSAKLHNLNGKVLGMGEVWKGGDDMANNPGGGHKVNLLKV